MWARTGCPDRRKSASAAHALTDWQGNTDTARCTALVQRVGAARALTTGRQYARARFPIDRRGVLLYPVSIGLKRVPHSNPKKEDLEEKVKEFHITCSGWIYIWNANHILKAFRILAL